jgi:hypothetical protein
MRYLRLTIATVLLFLASTARGQGPSRADTLFVDATALINEERYAEAIPMLEEAERLDPGIGTQFNLAVCYEKTGRLGTAYKNFAEVENLAAAAGKKPRQDAAHEKLESLRQRISYAEIRVTSPRDAAVTVRVDGEIVPPGKRDLVALDPGDHALVAEAPNRKPFETVIHVEGEAERHEIVVPELAMVAVKTEVRTVVSETSNTGRTVGFVLGGIGVAGLATAAVTGLMILSDKSTAEAHCKPECATATGDIDTEGADAVRRGKDLLPINLIAWGVAAAGIGAGTYFLISSAKKKSTKASITPTLDGRGVRFGAVF